MAFAFSLCLLHRDVFFKLKRCAEHISANLDIGARVRFGALLQPFLWCVLTCAAVTCSKFVSVLQIIQFCFCIWNISILSLYFKSHSWKVQFEAAGCLAVNLLQVKLHPSFLWGLFIFQSCLHFHCLGDDRPRKMSFEAI